MEYSTILGILAAFFGLIGAVAVWLKSRSPEPPPRGGVAAPKISFSEFRRNRGRVSQTNRETIVARRLAS